MLNTNCKLNRLFYTRDYTFFSVSTLFYTFQINTITRIDFKSANKLACTEIVNMHNFCYILKQ